ncbi:MAG TPA: carboxypeptidase-like regulatory domain-containing protein [Gemmatimonadales bacterium]|nr:carboxypeptidase-like regulatory domain-containing protein [Gemmatimonadales bacterium]
MNLNVRLIAALAALPLGACQSGPVGLSSVSILLKAPPGNVEASIITISRIELIGPTGAITLLHQPRTIDLLDPAQAPSALVSDYSVPALAYRELRVHLRGMYLSVRNPDGTTSSFVTPGFDGVPHGAPADRRIQLTGWHQDGRPVRLAEGTLDLRNDQTVLVLEFDPLGSLAPAGVRMAFEPRFTASELSHTSGIRVTLDSPDHAAAELSTAALLDPERGLVATAQGFDDTDSDGIFEATFGLLPAGNYRVVIFAPSGWLSEPRASEVAVAPGGASRASFRVVSGH